jgi:hypothetical protein
LSGRFADAPIEQLDAEGKHRLQKAGCPKPLHWLLEFPEVFMERGGFDGIVGNPPFMGGSKITGIAGTVYRDHLVTVVANGKKGPADLCAYFFLRAAALVRPCGGIGLLATNTIAQGDTREVGLDQLLARGWTIPRAVSSQKWPGTANLEVAHVWLRLGQWSGPSRLDGSEVEGITAWLTHQSHVQGAPFRLAKQKLSFLGSKTSGMGFVLKPEEARTLLANPHNHHVIRPFLNGEEFNSAPNQSASRHVIFFFNWPLSQAEQYPECLSIVRERVKPERDNNPRDFRREHWWLFGEPTPGLYAAIRGLKRVLVRSRVSNLNSIAFVSPDIVFSEAMVVFASDKDEVFAVLQAAPHTAWLSQYASSMRTDVRYTPSDCFDTFPFPGLTTQLAEIGQRYHEHRRQVMLARQEGLTDTYNRLNDREQAPNDIQTLRDLHVEMDNAVAAAYAWADLDLGHGFHETKQGLRFTISEAARREVLARLLKLNHERYAEEQKQAGAATKKPKSGGGRKKKSAPQGPTLF